MSLVVTQTRIYFLWNKIFFGGAIKEISKVSNGTNMGKDIWYKISWTDRQTHTLTPCMYGKLTSFVLTYSTIKASTVWTFILSRWMYWQRKNNMCLFMNEKFSFLYNFYIELLNKKIFFSLEQGIMFFSGLLNNKNQ